MRKCINIKPPETKISDFSFTFYHSLFWAPGRSFRSTTNRKKQVSQRFAGAFFGSPAKLLH
jgi:hypothetical protein